MKKFSKEEAQEYRKKQLEELNNQLVSAIEKIKTPEGWTKWLEFAATLPQYSFNNQVLLAGQAEERGITPRAFGPFSLWKKAGYSVNKGEKAYRILAPVLKKLPFSKKNGTIIDRDKLDTWDKADVIWLRKAVAFKSAATFEIGQTTAANEEIIPEELRPKQITGLAPEGLIENLHAVAEANNTPISYRPLAELNGAQGFFRYNREDPSKRDIVIGQELDSAGRAATLVHEVAHMHMHLESKAPTSQKEIEAESVAYLVAAWNGLDLTDRTVNYVAGWAGFDVDKVKEAAERVLAAANELTEQINPEMRAEQRQHSAELHQKAESVANQAAEKKAAQLQEGKRLIGEPLTKAPRESEAVTHARKLAERTRKNTEKKATTSPIVDGQSLSNLVGMDDCLDHLTDPAPQAPDSSPQHKPQEQDLNQNDQRHNRGDNNGYSSGSTL